MVRSQPTILWFAFATCYALIALTQYVSRSDANTATTYLNPPPERMEYFAFGFNESLADSLWLRWIQDGDVCQTYAGNAPPETKFDPTFDQTFSNPRHRNCDNSWSFKMLDQVTKLAPRFRMPYFAGTMTLAVLVEDYAGATVLFDRAVAQFPKDWEVLYRAGYHYLFDLKDMAKAGDLMKRAADNGGPYWIRFLAARLYSRAGQGALGIATLEAYLNTLDDPKQRDPVIQRISDLKKGLGKSPAEGP